MGQAMSWRESKFVGGWYMRSKLLRVINLLISRQSFIRQTGWLEVDLERLEISGRGRPLPWLVYGATDFLESSVSRFARVLELGGGGSTLFWLNRGNPVVTIETDLHWQTALQSATQGYENSRIHHFPKIDLEALAAGNLGKFDVVIVDHEGGGRFSSGLIEAYVDLLKDENSLLVFDNSERAGFQAVENQLAHLDFRKITFSGMGPINTYAWSTTLFCRSFVSTGQHEIIHP